MEQVHRNLLWNRSEKALGSVSCFLMTDEFVEVVQELTDSVDLTGLTGMIELAHMVHLQVYIAELQE